MKYSINFILNKEISIHSHYRKTEIKYLIETF